MRVTRRCSVGGPTLKGLLKSNSFLWFEKDSDGEPVSKPLLTFLWTTHRVHKYQKVPDCYFTQSTPQSWGGTDLRFEQKRPSSLVCVSKWKELICCTTEVKLSTVFTSSYLWPLLQTATRRCKRAVFVYYIHRPTKTCTIKWDETI